MIEIIKETDINARKVSNMATRPNSAGLYGTKKLTPAELKAKMDALPLLAIRKINEIINAMGVGGDFAKTLKFQNGDTVYTLQELVDGIFNGDLSEILIIDGKPLEFVVESLSALISAEVLRSTQKDDEFGESISDLDNRVDELSAKFDNTVNEITQSVSDAFASLIDYANSLAQGEVTV